MPPPVESHVNYGEAVPTWLSLSIQAHHPPYVDLDDAVRIVFCGKVAPSGQLRRVTKPRVLAFTTGEIESHSVGRA